MRKEKEKEEEEEEEEEEDEMKEEQEMCSYYSCHEDQHLLRHVLEHMKITATMIRVSHDGEDCGGVLRGVGSRENRRMNGHINL